MSTTATIEGDGRDLVLRQRIPAEIGEVWRFATESDRLARWFGSWQGDPSTGSVEVTMDAESDAIPPARFQIHECRAPRQLSVSTREGTSVWRLDVELVPCDGSRSTEVSVRHVDVDLAMVPNIGPGWEWYLDRLAAAVANETPPTLAEFESAYLPKGEAYRGLLDD